MAFDPTREDYQRLGLRFAASLDERDPASAARSFAGFGRRFAQDRDSLPQTDADRAFHLVALATSAIDYQMPFVSERKAQQLAGQAERYLDEALSLDSQCHDARRMLAAGDEQSFESYYGYLQKGADEVRRSCEQARDKATETASPERVSLERDIAMRPYVRWLSCEASKAVICGRNKEAIRICQGLFELDPQDKADARYTCALAYAKLEDEQGLDRLARLSHVEAPQAAQNAWIRLAYMALAHKQGDDARATRLIRKLLEIYPYAAEALIAQRELPDGVYARLAVTPFSEDELILAISEATVLLQEGRDARGRGALGSWLERTVRDIVPQSSLAEWFREPGAGAPAQTGAAAQGRGSGSDTDGTGPGQSRGGLNGGSGSGSDSNAGSGTGSSEGGSR